MTNVKQMRTLNGSRAADEIIVIVLKSTNQTVHLDHEDQELAYCEVQMRTPENSISWVHERLRRQVQAKHPNIVLEREDVNIRELVDFIGYQRKDWDNSQLKPERDLTLQVHTDGQYGISIIISYGQQGGAISFNANEQRFLYNERRDNQSFNVITDTFSAKLDEERVYQTRFTHYPIRVLLEFIERQVQNPPQGELYHWRRVVRPYDEAQGDRPTLRHVLLSEQQATLALAPPPAPPIRDRSPPRWQH